MCLRRCQVFKKLPPAECPDNDRHNVDTIDGLVLPSVAALAAAARGLSALEQERLAARAVAKPNLGHRVNRAPRRFACLSALGSLSVVLCWAAALEGPHFGARRCFTSKNKRAA